MDKIINTEDLKERIESLERQQRKAKEGAQFFERNANYFQGYADALKEILEGDE